MEIRLAVHVSQRDLKQKPAEALFSRNVELVFCERVLMVDTDTGNPERTDCIRCEELVSGRDQLRVKVLEDLNHSSDHPAASAHYFDSIEGRGENVHAVTGI